MNEYQGTFQRYEKKYLINELQYKLLRQQLQGRLSIDKYGKVMICNIYFDTPSRLLVRNSLERPVYKEKIRLRSYGTPTDGDTVFVELKKKYKGIVYKRRERMELSAAERYLYDRETLPYPTQIAREINWCIKFYKELVPSMYISYDRTAMYSKEDTGLRITFDRDILWREEELHLSGGSWGKTMLEEGRRLMEIKVPGAIPVWLSRILDELKIYPASFSKYGRGYQLLELQKKDNNKKGA